MSRIAVVALLLFLLLGYPVLAQGKATELKPGNPQRKVLLDTLRAPVERKLKKKVIFKVDEMRVAGNWAFMTGVPRKPDGSAMDYRETPYAEAKRAGAFDDWICALFRKSNGKWKVVEFAIGGMSSVPTGRSATEPLNRSSHSSADPLSRM